jgi:hypothetical protein
LTKSQLLPLLLPIAATALAAAGAIAAAAIATTAAAAAAAASQGTTTNGRYLLPFKTGAFLAGVPVLPTIIHYRTGQFLGALEFIDIVFSSLPSS